MCDVLGVSKSGYYDWKRSQIGSSDSPEKDYQLKRDIEDIFQGSRQAYGSPRVHHMLKGPLYCGENQGRKNDERIEPAS